MLPPFITAAPITAVLPLALLALVIGLSYSYRIVKQLNLSNERFRLLTTIHAFATEAVQHSLAILCVLSTAVFVKTIVDTHTACRIPGAKNNTAVFVDTPLTRYTTCTISGTMSMLLIGSAIMLIVVLHVGAIYSVDIIEGRVLLGTWTHPYGAQCFVITKTLLFGRRTSTKLQRRQPGRTLSEPTTQTDFGEVEVRLQERIRRLDYLDLAHPSAEQDHTSRPYKRRPAVGGLSPSSQHLIPTTVPHQVRSQYHAQSIATDTVRLRSDDKGGQKGYMVSYGYRLLTKWSHA